MVHHLISGLSRCLVGAFLLKGNSTRKLLPFLGVPSFWGSRCMLILCHRVLALWHPSLGLAGVLQRDHRCAPEAGATGLVAGHPPAAQVVVERGMPRSPRQLALLPLPRAKASTSI